MRSTDLGQPPRFGSGIRHRSGEPWDLVRRGTTDCLPRALDARVGGTIRPVVGDGGPGVARADQLPITPEGIRARISENASQRPPHHPGRRGATLAK
jgi:hypothetical protein